MDEGQAMKSVLVVDNQPLILSFIKTLLERKGHRALLAPDGLRALDVLEKELPDIVFVDLVMPNIDGRRLCRMIRGNARFEKTKLVVLSAIAAEESEGLKELGADLYIAKGPLPKMAEHIETVLDDSSFSAIAPGSILGMDDISPRDITGELLHTRRHLEIIMEHMSEGILEMSPEGRIVLANPSLARLTGKCELELLGKNVKELFAGKDGLPFQDMLEKALASKTKTEPGFMVLGESTLKVELFPLPDAGGGVIGIFSDVTELRRMEELLSLTLDGAPFPAAMIDTGHKMILWNRAMEKLTGVPRDGVLGRETDRSMFHEGWNGPLLMDLVLEGDHAGIRRWYKESVRPHPLFPEAYEGSGWFMVDGKSRYLHFVAARIRDYRGRTVGAIETVMDMTEREELQRQLQHAQKMQAVGTLAAGMAHEFNNILAAIQGYAQIMGLDMPASHPNAEYLKEILSSCQRAAGLIKKMLSFSRLEHKEKLPIKLNQLVEGVVQMVRQTLSPKMSLLLDLEPGLPFVMGDYLQLEQVIVNLCLNARDALPEGGEIRISTRRRVLAEDFCRAHPWARPGLYVELAVEDQGDGIPKELLNRIFEPFFTTKEPGQGTGLGLAIAYSIVKNHNGYITAQSPADSGRGACFRVFLPAMEEHEEDKVHGIASEELPTGNGERILIVDDEPRLLEIGRKMLGSHGYRTDTAIHGEEALGFYLRAMAEGDPYSLVILDIAMPVMDGKECLSRLLELDPEARVLISTGGPLPLEEASSQWQGAVGTLYKPFQLRELLETVRNALVSKGEPACSGDPP